MRNRWMTWLLVLAALLALVVGVGPLVALQGAGDAGGWISIAAAVAALLWIYWGLWCWRARRWVRWIAFGLVGTNLVALVAAGLWSHMSYRPTAILLAGSWVMGVVFFLGPALIRRLLWPSHPVVGVARTLIDEAVRMKVAIVFIVILALVVPIMPLLMDPKELLNYRLKTFLTMTTALTSLLLSLMTVFLATGSICNEIQQKQIFLTMSKPVGRAQYILGKWLGIMLLNVWLLATAWGSIYGFAWFLASQQAMDVIDQNTVFLEVMTARQSMQAGMPENMDFPSLVEERLRVLRRENPDVYGTEKEARPLPGPIMDTVRSQVITQWHAVPPNGDKTFVFQNLQHAKTLGRPLQLRVKPRAARSPPDGMVRIITYLNGRPYPVDGMGRPVPMSMAHDQFSTIPLPVKDIQDDGRLELKIYNGNINDPNETFPATVSFTPREGLELLYTVGSFEGNMFRGALLVGAQLAFLAALGLAVGSFLSFPVACLVCLVTFLVGIGGPFLAEAIRAYRDIALPASGSSNLVWHIIHGFFVRLFEGDVVAALKILISAVASLVRMIVPSLLDFSPTSALADGRALPLPLLISAALQLGFATVVVGLIGQYIFRRRELATVTN